MFVDTIDTTLSVRMIEHCDCYCHAIDTCIACGPGSAHGLDILCEFFKTCLNHKMDWLMSHKVV